MYNTIEDDNIIIEIVEVLVKYKIFPATRLRDLKIRLDYKKMREQKISGKKARQLLAEKHYVSIKTVEKALYGKR